MGQKRTGASQKAMSALPPKADMCGATTDVRYGPDANITASMSNRAGLRSPASTASRMRVASMSLLDCACCSADNELHAKSSATCMFFTVAGLKCVASAANERPQENRICSMPDRGASYHKSRHSLAQVGSVALSAAAGRCQLESRQRRTDTPILEPSPINP